MRQCQLSIEGMTCAVCVNSVTKQINKLDYINNCKVSIVTNEAIIVYDSDVEQSVNFKEIVEDCGFGCRVISDTVLEDESRYVKEAKLKIIRSDYSGVQEKLVSLNSHPLIKEASLVGVDILSIRFNQMEIGIRDLIDLIKSETDLDAILEVTDHIGSDGGQSQLRILSKYYETLFWKSTCLKACLCGVLTMTLYMGLPMLIPSMVSKGIFPYMETEHLKGLYYRDIIGFIVATFVQFKIGSVFYKATWNSLKSGTGTMDTLICISTTTAYCFSVVSIIYNINLASTSQVQGKLPMVVFDTSVMLIAFISLGKLMENKAKSQTSSALAKLISLTPSTCFLVEARNAVTEIPVEYLQINDIVDVKPGMKIPTDGVITKGDTEINESLITGESNLVYRKEDDFVIGGTINGPGHIQFKVTSIGQDTKLSNIIKIMKIAQLEKSEIQCFADKLASIFVPTIVLLSFVTLLGWLIIFHYRKDVMNPFFTALQISTSVIIVACPCALGLATPTAIMVGTGIAAGNGVLFKNSNVIENFNAKDIHGFIFDKTGTLTMGNMKVVNFIKYTNEIINFEESVFWKLIKATELLSEHPVAKSIVSYCDSKLRDTETDATVISSEIVLGQGIKCSCELDGQKYEIKLGSGHLLFPETSDIPNEDGYVLSFITINGTLCGKFEITDEVKIDSLQIVNFLQRRGFQVYMITGDNKESATKISRKLNIERNNCYYDVSPDGKCEIIRNLQDTKGRIVFVGDGINDSPALVTSDIGVAISTGTEIAMEASDIVILSNDEIHQDTHELKRLVYALDICEHTYRRIKLNLFWALCYNMFMIPLAMGVLVPWGIQLHPMVAGLAMACSSVSVVLSSLRLKQWRPPRIDDLEGNTSSDYEENFSWSKWFDRRDYTIVSQDLELQSNV
ncbi:hypothetical protein KAFR_0H00530 [Kazachstania africana CBS 2517]|uniref:P-type Cu(+) transporter n=1 Tax=Kazachstania africana (strain ATCC 22294 / BCRC 22015 / CBS 2517 / CECT 1963 / NBRC 1671 / NRRL Y-8276) TaxID=1071382 RepID=H2AYQ6_KAZAF|nr:hypothetical protein KAFR_0H00530 [Kazachstania africana CBS 2517]CCF59462.1 hypothetical protein KAFR_0H00530 [Kazachstania africana CBS 2517]